MYLVYIYTEILFLYVARVICYLNMLVYVYMVYCTEDYY